MKKIRMKPSVVEFVPVVVLERERDSMLVAACSDGGHRYEGPAMKTYRHDSGLGGPVRAKDASTAAMVLARRKYGNWGGVKSFRLISSRWLAHGEGWGEIGCKIWEAVLETVPSPMMLLEGPVGQPVDFTRRSMVVRLAHKCEVPTHVDDWKKVSTPASRLSNGTYKPSLMRTRANAGQ